jgi:hypothetical protein
MAERRDHRDARPVPEDDFERYLLGQIETQQVHFPKAVLLPPEEESGARGFPGSLWARLAALAGRLPRVLLTPAFAYAVVLVLLVPAYWGLTGLRPPRAPVPSDPPRAVPSSAPVAPARSADLGTPRSVHLGGGQVRADGTVTRVTVEESDDFVLLSFLAPIRSDPAVVYEATLTDAGGRVVAAKRPLRSTDGRGSFTLVCASALLAEGDYVLSVSEVSSGAAAEAPYQFRFRVARPAP